MSQRQFEGFLSIGGAHRSMSNKLQHPTQNVAIFEKVICNENDSHAVLHTTR
jgi:hypothetical protein